MAILDKLDIETEFPTDEEIARKFGWEDAYHTNGLSLWQKAKPKIYSLFDEPHSSTCARVSADSSSPFTDKNNRWDLGPYCPSNYK